MSSLRFIHGTDPTDLRTAWDIYLDDDGDRVVVDLYGDAMSRDAAMMFAADVLEVAGFTAELRSDDDSEVRLV